MRVLVLKDGIARAVEVKGKARVKATKRMLRMRRHGQTPSRAVQDRAALGGDLVAKGANARTVAVAQAARRTNDADGPPRRFMWNTKTGRKGGR